MLELKHTIMRLKTGEEGEIIDEAPKSSHNKNYRINAKDRKTTEGIEA